MGRSFCPAVLDLLRQAFQRNARTLGQLRFARLGLRGIRKYRAPFRDRRPPPVDRRPAAIHRVRGLRPEWTEARLPSAAPRSLNMARTLPKTLPTTKLSPACRVPFCTSTVATGPRPRSSLASSTVPRRRTIGHRLQVLQVGNQADHFHQQVEVGLLLGRDVDEHRAAAPVFGHQAAIGELLLDPVGQGIGLVDLVDGHDDRHVRRLGVVDGFQRLRHHAVIGGNHQHHDVGDLRSAGTHAGERLVARRIEEHDLAAEGRRVLVGDRHLVGADVLRDAAGFAFGDAGQANRVEQAGLAVIDVAHDGDHRRTRDRTGAGIFASCLRPARCPSPTALRR